MSHFPRSAMMAWSFAVVIFGVVLMGGAFTATDGITVTLYKFLGGTTPTMDDTLRFSVGLMGAVTLGWGLTTMAAASVSDRLDATTVRMLWQRITLANLAWYFVDCTISIATGFGLNAVSNTVFTAAFLLIVQRVRTAA